MALASENYKAQTNWFLHHRESGLRALGLILAAEIAIVGYALSALRPRTPRTAIVEIAAVGSILAMLAALCWFVGRWSKRSCTNAYRASLEYALMTTKVVTAMGHGEDPAGDRGCPVPEDRFLYVKRFVDDAFSGVSPIPTGRNDPALPHRTTDDFVALHLTKPDSTLTWAIHLLWAASWSGVVIAVAGAALFAAHVSHVVAR